MKNRLFYSLILIFFSFSQAALSQNFTDRAAQAYLDADKNFDVDCYYLWNKTFKLITPAGETKKNSSSISRDFNIQTPDRQIPMSFTLKRANNNFEYSVLFDQKYVSTNRFSEHEFYIAPVSDSKFALEFETAKIFCNVNFAYAHHYPLEDRNYHFNIHPHKAYDWQNILKAPVEKYLNNKNFNSIIFLDTGNYRGNLVNIDHFLNGIQDHLPHTDVDTNLINVPSDTPLIVSPAGNNRFEFKAKNNINITFTGGNHNYCIWNVTRHVLEALMNSTSEAKVNFFYDLNAIVAQKRGIERLGLNFNGGDVNRSNLLSNLLSKPEVQKSYHPAFLNYFSNFLAQQFSGMYRTYKINYKAQGFEKSMTLEGAGTRNLEVNFNYF